jgi:hypothetical protein
MPEHSSLGIADDAESFRVIKKMYLQRERELAAAQRISEALSQGMDLQDLIEAALSNTIDGWTLKMAHFSWLMPTKNSSCSTIPSETSRCLMAQ